MINLYHKTPQVYYDDSRDFQTIARVLEILSNESKTEIDLIRECPFSKDVDVRLLSLLAKTIGFDNKHKYNESEFRAICSSFVEIMHNKGSMRGIELTIETFLAAQGISGRYRIIYAGDNVKSLTIVLPVNVSSTTLLEDVFDYIMPAGQEYTFLYADVAGKVEDAKIVVSTEAEINKTFSSGKLSVVSNNTNTTVPTYENLLGIDESSIAYIGVVSDGTAGEGPTPGPITDLTGTKWLLNGSLGTYPGWEYYYLNFQSNNQTFSAFAFDGGDNTFLKYEANNVYRFGVGNVGWIDEDYRTIEITGGADVTNASLISWLQEHAVQVPTDLTGTKWVFNEQPSLTPPNASINFTSNGNSYTSLSQRLHTWLRYNDTLVYYDGAEGWDNQAYRIIEITGGTDVTDDTFIEWLMQNATQVPVVDLSDTEWVIRDDAVNAISGNTSYSISFSSNSMNYNELSTAKSGPVPSDSWYIAYDNDEIYTATQGWDNQAYRMISITGGSDASNPSLLTWLMQNAMQM